MINFKFVLLFGIFSGLLACGEAPKSGKGLLRDEDFASHIAKLTTSSAEADTAKELELKPDQVLLDELIDRLKKAVERVKSDTQLSQENKDKIVALLEKRIADLDSDPDVQEETLDRLKKGQQSVVVDCEKMGTFLSTETLPELLRADLEKRYKEKCSE